MGYFRFLLAALVAVTHVPGYDFEINVGVSAVIAFYFLSGYLMTLSFGRFREGARHPARAFFVDRVVRLYPVFLLALAVSGAWALWTGVAWNSGAGEWLAQLTVIPMSYLELMSPVDRPHGLPPTWSLGVEAQFYLLLPLVLGLGRRARLTLLGMLVVGHLTFMHVGGSVRDLWPGCSAISARFCDVWQLSDTFAYRWLPFGGLPFLLGSIAFDGQRDRISAQAFKATIGLYAVVFLLQFVDAVPVYTMDREIGWAMALLIPLALFAAQRRAVDPLDDALGKLAYPMFVFHNVAIAISGGDFLAASLLTIALSIVAAVLQARIDAHRYRLRQFGRVTERR